jgi:hypothetical protein
MAIQKPDAGQFDDVGFLISGALTERPNHPVGETAGPTFALPDPGNNKNPIQGHLDPYEFND